MSITTIPSSLTTAWLSGMALGLGLFAIVGAQTAFILRQGMRKEHLGTILLICAIIDTIMIFSSVECFQELLQYLPGLSQVIGWLGVLFLLGYAAQSGWRALYLHEERAHIQKAVITRRAAVWATLGFSLLNPHFWLDMMVVGTVAQGFGQARLAFASGALSASLLWLSLLGAGCQLLAPWFSSKTAWRVLDGLIAIIMFGLGVSLFIHGINKGFGMG